MVQVSNSGEPANDHGWTRLINAHMERRLAHVVRSNRRATVAQIAKEVNAGSGRRVSEYIMHRSLLCMGLHSCRPVPWTPAPTIGHLSILNQPWRNGRRWPGVMNHVFFYIVRVSVRPHGTRVHYGTEQSRWWQCDSSGNVLLGNLGSCHPRGCYFDTDSLAKAFF